jgi:hypothetical protein
LKYELTKHTEVGETPKVTHFSADIALGDCSATTLRIALTQLCITQKWSMSSITGGWRFYVDQHHYADIFKSADSDDWQMRCPVGARAWDHIEDVLRKRLAPVICLFEVETKRLNATCTELQKSLDKERKARIGIEEQIKELRALIKVCATSERVEALAEHSQKVAGILLERVGKLETESIENMIADSNRRLDQPLPWWKRSWGMFSGRLIPRDAPKRGSLMQKWHSSFSEAQKRRTAEIEGVLSETRGKPPSSMVVQFEANSLQDAIEQFEGVILKLGFMCNVPENWALFCDAVAKHFSSKEVRHKANQPE